MDKFKIGHAEDLENGTGVTVILCEEGATAGGSVRGNAPGTREIALLKADALVEKVHAVVLTGGSAFGLESSCGVMDYLREKKIGYFTGKFYVPIVTSAVLYDLEYKNFAFPDKSMGYQACVNAKCDNLKYGANVGAGTGACCGKIMGIENCQKSGLGVATSKLGDLELTAVVGLNAFGDIYDVETNEIIRGANINGQFINTCDTICKGLEFNSEYKNTTIGCVFTNAKLTKAQANKLADQTHDAFAMSIKPVHTMVDGDTIFALASGEVECQFMQLGEIAVKTMTKAIQNAVKGAKAND